jgi:hypothetical protein
MDEIVVDDLGIRPTGIERPVFDDEAEAVISVVTIRPGRVVPRIPAPRERRRWPSSRSAPEARLPGRSPTASSRGPGSRARRPSP